MPLAEIVRSETYVPETKKAADLLREMQREKFHMALVTDEYGSVTGLVSLEDLLEELVGEITDEYDQEEPEIVQVGEDAYRVSGKASVDDVNELLGTQLPDEEWDTVAGLVLDLFGKIPRQGEEITMEGLCFRAEEVLGRRIAKLVITRVEPVEGGRRRRCRDLGGIAMNDDQRAQVDGLVAAARAARERAYAPYSNFLVGAAVVADGEVFAAPNIENASYPMSVCAERNAVAVAVAAGHRRIEAVAVMGSGASPTPPCGGCRQVLYEFGGPGLTVICESPKGERKMWALEDLLPEAFGPDDLTS